MYLQFLLSFCIGCCFQEMHFKCQILLIPLSFAEHDFRGRCRGRTLHSVSVRASARRSSSSHAGVSWEIALKLRRLASLISAWCKRRYSQDVEVECHFSLLKQEINRRFTQVSYSMKRSKGILLRSFSCMGTEGLTACSLCAAAVICGYIHWKRTTISFISTNRTGLVGTV